MGVLGAAQLSPFLLLGLFAGAWVDRMRRRPILIAADLGRAALLGSIPVAMLLGVAYAMIPLAAALRSEAVVLLVIVAGLSGLGGTIYNIGYNIGLLSLRQSATPDHLLGRVSGTMQFLMCGARCRSAHC